VRRRSREMPCASIAPAATYASRFEWKKGVGL
jgi:hypothetical protein